MINYTWHEATHFDGLDPITQVYGVCFDGTGRILLLRQAGHPWNIPGGRPEAGETPGQTLTREVYEETTVKIGRLEMIGYQTLDGADPLFYQLRFAALVERIDPLQPDPDKGATHERQFVTPDELIEYIEFPQYKEMFETALRWYRTH